MKKSWTMGDLEKISENIKHEIETLYHNGWSGVFVGPDIKNDNITIRLILISNSRLDRWLYNHGLKTFPPYPSKIDKYFVSVEARSPIYFGGPPLSIFDKIYDIIIVLLNKIHGY